MGLSGFRKEFKVLISHRFSSILDVAKASKERGSRIYGYKQAYRKASKVFFGRGLRHLHAENPKRVAELKPGDRLYVMPDIQNEHDEKALLLRTDDPITLAGYAPRYFSGEFSQLLSSVGAEKVKVLVEKVNHDAPLQYRILCRIIAPWPVSGLIYCSGGMEYRYLVERES